MTDCNLPDNAFQPDRSQNPRNAIGVVSLILCAIAIGFATFQHGGEYTWAAIALITFAIFAAVVAVIASGKSRRGGKGGSIIWIVVGGLIAIQFVATIALWPVGVEQSTGYRIALAASTFILIALIAWSVGHRTDITPRHGAWWVEYAFAAAFALEFFALFTLWPVGVDQTETFRNSHSRFIYLYLVGASGFLVLVGSLNIRNMARWWFPALLVVHSVLGFWTVRACPFPHIDVWYFQEVAPNALIAGKNPYDYAQVRFEDIYDSTLPGHQQVYGQGMVEDNRLKFGFPYPPISLYCSTIGVYFGQDTRFAQAMALTLAGLLIGYSRPGRLAKLAASLLLFTPTVCFVIGRAWTEPFVILFLAGTVFCAARKLRWLLPIALGLFLASKQYLIFAVPLSFLLLHDFDWRTRASWLRWFGLLFGAFLVVALVTLPLALRDFHAFWFSMVTVQQDAPFRWDALSYLGWIGRNIDTKYTTWTWLAFAGAGLALLLSLWKARRGPAGFAAAMSLTYLLFIAFNKQAFCNYYFFVIACVCCALATMPSGNSDAI